MANAVALSTLPGPGRVGHPQVRLNGRTKATLQRHSAGNFTKLTWA